MGKGRGRNNSGFTLNVNGGVILFYELDLQVPSFSPFLSSCPLLLLLLASLLMKSRPKMKCVCVCVCECCGSERCGGMMVGGRQVQRGKESVAHQGSGQICYFRAQANTEELAFSHWML